ncbi:MAG: ParB/RepB/Spo0J family partition protein [Patescibacteria group bacterium]
MSKTRGLGRGLSALIPELEEAENEGRLELSISDIRPNPYQPRHEFDPVKLAELTESIKEHGVLQPVLVRRVEGGYELIAGERRLRAAELAGLAKIPAVIRDLTDVAMMEVALVENLQREDLNPMDEAEAYRRLVEEFHLTQEDVAQRVGKSRSAVANILRLLNLPRTVQADLGAGRSTVGHARAILGLKSEEEQLAIWKDIMEGNLSVRETENLVRRRAEKTVPRETLPRRSAAEPPDPNLRAAEEEMRRALGTKVRIHRAGESGRIEIEFYSQEDLTRILETITLKGARST